MAKKFKQVVSEDALTIMISGDVRNPEPSTLVIKFPGGHVEISRCSDNTYWAHLEVVSPANVVDSRVEHNHEGYIALGGVPDFPRAEDVKKVALRIANRVPHPDHA